AGLLDARSRHVRALARAHRRSVAPGQAHARGLSRALRGGGRRGGGRVCGGGVGGGERDRRIRGGGRVRPDRGGIARAARTAALHARLGGGEGGAYGGSAGAHGSRARRRGGGGAGGELKRVTGDAASRMRRAREESNLRPTA